MSKRWATLAVLGAAVCSAGWVLELSGRRCLGAAMVTGGAFSAAALVFAGSRRVSNVQVWAPLLLFVVLALSRLHTALACLQ